MSVSASLLQALTDPIVQAGSLAFAGAMVSHIVLRGYPRGRFAGQFALFVALTALLFYHGIVPYAPTPKPISELQNVFVGIAKIIWWVNAALTLAGFVRVFLIFERRPRESQLLQDLLVGLVYVGATLSVVAYVFSFPVGTLIATSGVLAIILGLALQSSLNDVFSGIALNLGKAYAVGDWIVLADGSEGQVLETNWRATYLLNGSNDLVTVPNSSIAKATLTNRSAPARAHGSKVTVRLLPTKAPGEMCAVMAEVLLSCQSIQAEPPPQVFVTSIDATAIVLDLTFRVADFANVGAAKNEIFDLIFRHTKAAGVLFAPPSDSASLPQPGAFSSPGRSTALRLLDVLPLFAGMNEEEKEALAARMTRRSYRKGEVVGEQGVALTMLMIVRRGVLAVTRSEGQRSREIARLAPGDFFGEMGLLTGEGERGTILALTSVVVYSIDKESLAPLIHERPSIAEEIGAAYTRQLEIERRRLNPHAGEGDAGNGSTLAERIRHFLRMPPG
ncbi:cyclic nucleotide-binding domain-containing protein [Segnochrobactrum spirostomi]|uniref:Mechanosensitive ion channel n=1 Tax=Segnochrobactrum spirostomi TaxID=2608987 RepID=A0A6A7Y0V6_9HYPH|nr:mechanosensitive ion channel family protein [Segnochrobactrum spirostomi]MQT12385.1 mechanosensitive ion channel [Segnochrobactrum spirostomi]